MPAGRVGSHYKYSLDNIEDAVLDALAGMELRARMAASSLDEVLAEEGVGEEEIAARG